MRYLGVVSVLLSVVVVGPALAMLGDVDGSGRVDGVDLTILSRLLGSTRGDAVFRETADLNGDGRIDEKDVAILRANFARTGRGQNVWVADTANDRLVELSPMTGHTLVTVGGVPAPVRLALDTGRGDVWAIAAGGTQVVHVSPSGRRLATVRGFGKATALAVDPGDGSCWVADRNARKLYGLRHNAPDGSDVSASRSFYRLVEGLSYGTLGPTCLALDGSRGVLWLADGRLVRLLTSVPAYYNLSTGTGSHWINYQQLPATVLAVNQLDGTCFTGSAQAGSLVRVGATNSGTVLTVANLPGLNGMAANGMDGSVWLATTGQDSSGTTTQLIHLGNDGTELSRASISGFADLGVDPSSGEVWVANPLANGVSRYSAGGSCTLQASQFSRPTAVQPFPGDPILGAPVVSAVVNPTRAEVGQPVTFFANLLSGRNPVARVEWDFTGRGVFDFSSGTSFTTTRAYQAAGVFNPIVRVTDTAGLSGTDYTALVRVGGLSVRLGASIVQGTAPLTVNFTASAVNPSGAPLANFQWDFDGDGVYDAYQTATGSTATASHTYAAGGTFDAAVKVIDSQARMASGSVVVHVAAPVPTLTLSASPFSGQAPLVVRLSATANPSIALAYQWDPRGTGRFDRTTVGTGQLSVVYSLPGTYTARVRTIDFAGGTALATAPIEVLPAPATASLPPVGFLTVTPVLGRVPLAVDFSGVALDPDGHIGRYEYRFDSALLADDVETAGTAFVPDAGWARTAEAASGSYSWTCSLKSGYGLDSSLTSREVAVSGPASLLLSLAHKYRSSYYGREQIELSENGGGWQSLATFGGASALASQDQFVSTTVSVPVTPSTTSIRIRFRLSSPYYGSSAEWSVDNLALQPAGAPADFTSATTMATRHTYAAAGDYYPLLTLTDDAGVSASWPAHVRVLAADEPLAVASATPASGRTPLTVRLSSAGSSGGSGPITRYQWFLDRGVFFDDMESGPAKWVSQPPWALTSETATGGRWSWSDSPNGNYANSVNSSLTSIPFDLPAQPVRSTLSFWHRYVTESCCDRCYVELSTDGGGTWQQLRDEAGNYIAYGGSQSQFTRASIPLSPYAGTRGARIRFRFTSDSSVTYDGWHIDDVRIATDPVTAAIPDYDSVSTGDTTIQYDIPGRYSPRLRLTGSGGLTAEAATSVTVATTTGTPVGETLPVSLYANTSGYAPPVQTQFTANVTSTGHRVIRYDWDFDGDGVVDAFTTDTNTTRFGYIRPGPVRASVRVLDDAGNSGTASTQFNISFSTPSVSLATDRTSLSLGQTVTFVPSVSASGTVTSFAWSFGPSGATYSGAGTPVTTAFRFASQGYYYATLRVSDEFGGGGSAGISLQVVGTDYPTVTLTPSTTQGATPLDVVFTVGVTPGDGSGSNLVRYDWDFDGVPADNRTLTTSAPQTFHYTRDGVFQPRVTVTDAWNRAMSARTRLTFGTPPVSQPSAAPVAGQAPLTVVFQCAGRASSGSLVLYDWDFLGHGVFPGVLSAWSADVSNATQTWIGKPLVYTYSEPGVYDATLRVTDRNGLQGTGKVRISVGPRASAAALIAQPPVGAAPLTVQFTAGLTAGRRVLGYQFDATGNGPFSLTTSSNSFEATYPAPGDYHPRVLVRSEGAADATSECTLHVRAANGPAATLQAENTSGSAPLDVTFHGSGVSTYGIAARYDWDFDGDGTFEYSSRSASSVIHTYAEAGAYTPTLRVTDLLGRTDRASITVKASPGLVVQRETESFDPQQGESLSVDSALSSTTSVRLRIVDRFHQAVRTLLPFTVRGPGPHVDHWDGKDDLGRLVGGGVYYYILDYAVSGVTGTLDSSGQAPTFRYFYPSSEQTFDPFANKPLTVRYTLSRSAEVSIYVFSSGGAGNQTIARTVLLREPQTTGQYVVAWDGALDDGNVAGSLQSGGSSVAYVMPAYISDLPDNALIVAGRPLLSDVSSDPPLFTPDNPYQASGGLFSSIHFWLSKASSITAQVQSPTGQIVRTFTQRDLIRGPQSVRWDGRTDAGGLAHLGLYRIGLEATDSTGLKSPRQTSVVKVAY